MSSQIADKAVGRRKASTFDRALHFYQTFDVIAALPAIIASVVMAFSGFQNRQKTNMIQISEALLASCVATSVIALTLAKMLIFRFEGHQHSMERESKIIWLPTVLVDMSIFEVLAGLIFWIVDSYSVRVALLIGVEVLVLLAGTMALAWKMCTEEFALRPPKLDGPKL